MTTSNILYKPFSSILIPNPHFNTHSNKKKKKNTYTSYIHRFSSEACHNKRKGRLSNNSVILYRDTVIYVPIL